MFLLFILNLCLNNYHSYYQTVHIYLLYISLLLYWREKPHISPSLLLHTKNSHLPPSFSHRVFFLPSFLQLHPKNSYQSPPSLPSSATCFLPLSSSHIPRTATSLPSSATHFSHSFPSFSHTPGTPGNFLQKSQSLQPYPREVFSNPPFLCSRDAPQTPDRRRWWRGSPGVPGGWERVPETPTHVSLPPQSLSVFHTSTLGQRWQPRDHTYEPTPEPVDRVVDLCYSTPFYLFVHYLCQGGHVFWFCLPISAIT